MHAAAEDRSIIFRAIIAHHPIFTLYYNDVMLLFDEFLPELRLFGYDFYFGGLEPMLSYSNYPLDQLGNGRTNHAKNAPNYIDDEDRCYKRSEFFPRNGREATNRTVMASQGEFLNQIVSGAGGTYTFPICEWNMWRSHGNFIYGESKYNGFVLVHAMKEMVEVKYKGVHSNPHF